MGMAMSAMGKVGLPSTQTITDQLYKSMETEKIKDFEQFHTAILEVFTKINSGMPGLHYDVPKRPDVVKSFDEWKKASTEEKKDVLKQLLEKATLSKSDNAIVATGVVAPPAAMILKKTGENIPQLNKLKLVPDIVFVPSTTLVALILVKLYRKSTLNVDENAPTKDTTSTAQSDSASTSARHT